MFTAIIAVGTLATIAFSKSHHQHHHHLEDSTKFKEMINTNYPNDQPNKLCLAYSEDGRLFHNLQRICKQNNQAINFEISEERSAIHEKIFNELKLTPEDIEIACSKSDYNKKLSATEIYEFMIDDVLNELCGNSKEADELIDRVASFGSVFPKEVKYGVMTEENASGRTKAELLKTVMLKNSAIGVKLLKRYFSSVDKYPIEIDELFPY
ncbi:unnamed protein product [Caenorhabditis angaria]|uniref:Uncharacterized protein n=1 Tax=Caenorhabditis angaria TaxID=860376 RepID=A0A9P1ISH2_9PELO|nr:unnamed protein product [Caenorhabditis angaria]